MIQLRPWSMNDLTTLIELANDYEIANYMADVFPYPYTMKHGRKFIETTSGEHPVHIFAIIFESKPVGAIGIHPQTDIMRKNAELGYWLGKKYWGKGIITEAVQQIIPVAFRLYDITRLYARTFGSNLASQKVLMKAGFTKEASISKSFFKNGRFEDEIIYAIRKNELSKDN